MASRQVCGSIPRHVVVAGGPDDPPVAPKKFTGIRAYTAAIIILLAIVIIVAVVLLIRRAYRRATIQFGSLARCAGVVMGDVFSLASTVDPSTGDAYTKCGAIKSAINTAAADSANSGCPGSGHRPPSSWGPYADILTKAGC